MTRYSLIMDGTPVGDYAGENSSDALDAYARDAGFASWEAGCEDGTLEDFNVEIIERGPAADPSDDAALLLVGVEALSDEYTILHAQIHGVTIIPSDLDAVKERADKLLHQLAGFRTHARQVLR